MHVLMLTFCINSYGCRRFLMTLKLKNLKKICEQLMNRCLAPDCQMGGLGCDNMTVVLVCFLNGESYEKLADRCKLAPLPLSQVANLNNNILNNTNTNNNTSK